MFLDDFLGGNFISGPHPGSMCVNVCVNECLKKCVCVPGEDLDPGVGIFENPVGAV